MIYTYQHNGQSHRVDLQPNADGTYTSTVNGRTYVVQATAFEGGWRLVVDGERQTVYTAAQGNTRYVSAAGNSYALTLPDARASRRRTAGGGGDLTAQMPGQVVNVLVAEGESVTRGQPLVVLEAMKMEIRAAAPSDGVVKRVLVKKGDVVERGQLLAEVEAKSD